MPAFIACALLLSNLAAVPLWPVPPAPAVPAALDAVGLHLDLTADAQHLVQQRVDSLCRDPRAFQARVARADAAFPLLERVLAEEGVPPDFRYVALLESDLLATARARPGKAGFWLLSRAQAQDLGLLVNGYVDEREHLVASTHAAARLLARRHEAFNNWLAALLSYRTGLARVGPDAPLAPYATRMTLDRGTAPDVLLFLAYKIAFDPACGRNRATTVCWREYPAVPGQSLGAQARALRLDPAALAGANPWLRAPVVPIDRPYTLLVPCVGEAARESPPGPPGRNPAEVRVNSVRALMALPGETLADLARRGHRPLPAFLGDNELTAFDRATVGRPYFLESKRSAAAAPEHVVRPGEAVLDVAQLFGMTQREVRAKNRMLPAEPLLPGRVLWLQRTRPGDVPVEYRLLPEDVAWASEGSATSSGAERLVFPYAQPTASAGPTGKDHPHARASDGPDTLFGGKAGAGAPPGAVASGGLQRRLEPAKSGPWGHRADPVQVGPAPAAAPPRLTFPRAQEPGAVRSHRVVKGETLYGLARRYGTTVPELQALNGKPGTTVKAGEVVRLPTGKQNGPAGRK
jgi:membrane-bound lytic murein transglycosylase D